MSRPEYRWLPSIPETQVGSKEYKDFKKWLDRSGRWRSRMPLKTMKFSLLIDYLAEYRKIKNLPNLD